MAKKEGGETPEPQLPIIKTNPTVVEQLLIEKLPVQVVSDKETIEIIKKIIESNETPTWVAAIVHTLLRHYLVSPLSYTVPPDAPFIVHDRFAQIISLLVKMVNERIDQLDNEIDVLLEQGRKEELQKRIREINDAFVASMLAAKEVLNRLVTLYKINMPAYLRPPLIQSKIGVELPVWGPAGGGALVERKTS